MPTVIDNSPLLLALYHYSSTSPGGGNMAKHRGGKAKHAPGYICLKAAKVSPDQARARAKKAKEITDSKRNKQQEQATAVSLAKKAAKVQRRAEADAVERERRYKRY